MADAPAAPSSDRDLTSIAEARALAKRAKAAAATLAEFSQPQIDAIVDAMAAAATPQAEAFARLAVEETGYGVPDDKREKNRFAAEDVWNYFRGLRTRGVVSETKDVVEIASPRGVVAGIAVQSGSCSITATTMSVYVAPTNACRPASIS